MDANARKAAVNRLRELVVEERTLEDERETLKTLLDPPETREARRLAKIEADKREQIPHDLVWIWILCLVVPLCILLFWMALWLGGVLKQADVISISSMAVMSGLGLVIPIASVCHFRYTHGRWPPCDCRAPLNE